MSVHNVERSYLCIQISVTFSGVLLAISVPDYISIIVFLGDLGISLHE